MSVLIVDDELPARERLQRLVGEIAGWNVAGSCATGVEALQLAPRLKPAVVLLDIRMPGLTGIEVARHLGTLEEPPAVVFTTAYDEYALQAFESQAVGYLLKPVRRERLEQALKHASRLSPLKLKQLATPEQPLAARQHVAVRVRDELKLIPIKDIRYDQKLDCSSSTSKALYDAGLFEGRDYAIVSGSFDLWGAPGKGRTFSVYYNGDHVWIRLHRTKWWRFDTSPHGDGGRGPRLRMLPRFTRGFAVRHFPGM